MPVAQRPRLADSYLVTLLAMGPGAAAGATSWLMLGYGIHERNLLIVALYTYVYFLLWSLPAIPFTAAALVSWIPGRRPGTVRELWRPLLFVLASTWHLLVWEGIDWLDAGPSFLRNHWKQIVSGHLPAACCTVAAWALVLWSRRGECRPPEA